MSCGIFNDNQSDFLDETAIKESVTENNSVEKSKIEAEIENATDQNLAYREKLISKIKNYANSDSIDGAAISKSWTVTNSLEQKRVSCSLIRSRRLGSSRNALGRELVAWRAQRMPAKETWVVEDTNENLANQPVVYQLSKACNCLLLFLRVKGIVLFLFYCFLEELQANHVRATTSPESTIDG